MGEVDAEHLAKQLFKRYYRSASLDPPSGLEKREFGFVFFQSKGMVRHVGFPNGDEMRKYIVSRIPRHAYYSSAYYSNPSAEKMDEKGWLGADLIFDIDVDHIYTPCKELHDYWVCRECGAEGWGFVLKCPRCGSERITRQTWVCDTCIAVSRDETLKLVEFLEEDFGISDDEMYATFSGHRGFHLHIENEVFREVGQEVRREISDYVRGVGLAPELFLVKKGRRYVLKYGVEAPGWGGRIARYVLYKYADQIGEGDVTSIKLTLPGWKSVFQEAVSEEHCEIDEKVTIDLKRLIRLPNSLHGKTGLRVLKLSVNDLDRVDVLRKAVVVRNGEAIVKMRKPPRRVLWYTLDPSKDRFRVPLHLALYLALNGGAAIERVL